MTVITAQQTDTLLDALRSNLSLLGELAVRYEVNTILERPEDPPSIGSPRDIHSLLGPEMAPLAQEQLRVLLLDNKNQVLGQRVIYQGNISSAIVRPAEVLRPAVTEAVPPASSSATITPRRTPRPARRTRPSPGSWQRRASCWASSCWTTW